MAGQLPLGRMGYTVPSGRGAAFVPVGRTPVASTPTRGTHMPEPGPAQRMRATPLQPPPSRPEELPAPVQRLGRVAIEEILVERVAERMGYRFDDLVGEARERNITEARHVAMALVREQTDLSYPAIGKLFNRDHTTVMSGVQRINELLATGDRPDLELVMSDVSVEVADPTEPTFDREMRMTRNLIESFNDLARVCGLGAARRALKTVEIHLDGRKP